MDDASLLRAALVGYRNQLAEIDRAIAEIRRRLGGRGSVTSNRASKPRVRRELSAAARKRIADAQKKRWAAFHKQKQAQSK